MNKYARVPDLIVDLHRHTIREATRVLDDLLAREETLHVRLIVGKGIHSEKGPVLRDFVVDYLHERGIRFARAKLVDGGEGALEAFL